MILKKYTYPMDVFPAFWDKLSALAYMNTIGLLRRLKVVF